MINQFDQIRMKIYNILDSNEYFILWGSYDKSPKKHAFNKKVTLDGKTVVQYSGNVKNDIQITIKFMRESDYNKLVDLWGDSAKVNFITDDSEIQSGLDFSDESIDLKRNYDISGNLYYTGTINLES